MDSIQQEVKKCKAFFKKNYTLDIPADWLKQCIEFAFEDGQTEDSQNTVYDQLCDFDLSEIGTTSLPKIITATESGTIEGVFLVQINLILDASDSYFSTLQKILGKINENALVDADNVPGATQFERRFDKKSRLMTLFLTDGDISIKAIEHQTMHILDDEILPGRKAILKGRIQFQNNVLFLTPNNIEILKGSVEEMSTAEHFVELLDAELQAKKNMGPPSEREITKKFDGIKLTSQIQKTSTQKTQNNFSNNSQNFSSKPNNYSNKNKNMYVPDDDDDGDDILEVLDSMESNLQKNPPKNILQMKRAPSSDTIVHMETNRPNYKSQNIIKKQRQHTIPDSDEEDLLLMQDANFMGNIESNIVKSNTNTLSSNKNIVNYQNNNMTRKPELNNVKKEYTSYEDMTFKNSPINFKEENGFKRETNIKQEQRSIIKQEQNIPYIHSLMDFTKKEFLELCCLKNQPYQNSSTLATCSHLVKCSIETLTDRLRQYNLKWYQDCRIKDTQSVARIDAYIGDKPMNKLLGLTVTEVKEKYLKKQSGDYDHAKSECDKKLEKILCIMHLKYDFDKRKFCVWEIENETYC